MVSPSECGGRFRKIVARSNKISSSKDPALSPPSCSPGILVALVTPLDEAGEVQLASIRPLVEHVLGLGINGLYVCGSTGEGFSLSPDERMAVVESIVTATADRVPIIVNVSHMEFRQVVRLADHAKEVGASAVSSLPPIYFPISAAELLSYFRALLDCVQLPLTLYNIPQLAHRALDEMLVGELASDERLIGIKHSSEDTQMLVRFKQISGGRLLVWSGRDAFYLGCLAMGADGAIGSSFNLLGDLFSAVTRLFRAGDHATALALQHRINPVHARLQVNGSVQSIKRCLSLAGVECGECRLPYGTIGTAFDDYFRQTLEMADRVRSDFNTSKYAGINARSPHSYASPS
jgi:N-acetylneuraminate lyase